MIMMMIMRMIRKGDHLHNDYIDNDDNDVEDDNEDDKKIAHDK